jgi:phage gp36-like protein
LSAPYCVRADLPNYIAAAALAPIATAVQDQACIDASSTADSYLRGRYGLPLSAWGQDLRRYTAHVAIYLLMTGRGFSPQGGADRQITERYYAAVGWPDRPGSGWFPGVQRQSIHPDVTPAQALPGDPVHDVPQIASSPPRGWTSGNFGGVPSVGGF